MPDDAAKERKKTGDGEFRQSAFILNPHRGFTDTGGATA